MMGQREPQEALFSYAVNLEQRVRADNPLRRVKEAVDFSFAREEVATFYGYNGHRSEDPALLLKLMFLLFFDDIKSERELLRVVPERLDYLWFLDLGLDDAVPHHSVLSKARRRWGHEVFEALFVRTIAACIGAGLVDGGRLHVDGSLIEANASNQSVLQGPPEVIAALKHAFRSQEAKLDEWQHEGPPQSLDERPPPAPSSQRPKVNDRLICRTDPDAPVVRQKGGGKANRPRPRYKNHRAVDDAQGVITGCVTTAGDVDEGRCLPELVEQHREHTEHTPHTVVGDSQYGTIENFRYCGEQQLTVHLVDRQGAHDRARRARGLFTEADFTYDAVLDCYFCPAGQQLTRRRRKRARQAVEYALPGRVCNACPLKAHCTTSKQGRSLKRHDQHELIQQARAESRSPAARRDQRRRATLMEGSFAQGANNHGFKQARWRGLLFQRIQDFLIAAVQNIKLLITRRGARRPPDAQAHPITEPAESAPQTAPIQLLHRPSKHRRRHRPLYLGQILRPSPSPTHPRKP